MKEQKSNHHLVSFICLEERKSDDNFGKWQKLFLNKIFPGATKELFYLLFSHFWDDVTIQKNIQYKDW